MKPAFKAVVRIPFIVLALSIFLLINIPVHAQEYTQKGPSEESAKIEVVVLLDCSSSMKETDKEYLLPDFIKSLSAAMPEKKCKIGVVVYNDGICCSLPPGSSYAVIEDGLKNIEYRSYGNAGLGLETALGLFQDGESQKRIILLSDGEIVMDAEEKTEESARQFSEAVQRAKEAGIPIDVLAFGEPVTEGHTVYAAAEATGGNLTWNLQAEALDGFLEQYLFEEWDLHQRHVGKLSGTDAQLAVTLPDCFMEDARIILSGEQQNENLTVNCEADRINVLKGQKYTVIELQHPGSADVTIQMGSDTGMDIDAYLMADYEFTIDTGHTYDPESRTAAIWLEIINPEGRKLLEGHLQDSGIKIYLDGEEQNYRVTDGKAYMEKVYEEDGTASLQVKFDDSYASYYGDPWAEETITVPVMEEEPEQPDWFFWSVISVFVVSVILIFYLAYKKKKSTNRNRKITDESRTVPKKVQTHKNDFYGKILIYVIHNKEDIDYPPESINLFARCNRDMITLEWILDTCNLPLHLDDADRIIIKPGDDKSLVIKNNSKASALMGRELLIKGRSYHMYYQEKVTFIFDKEDAEIEVHYKDLKPNER